MLCRCIHDKFNGFKSKVNTTVYQVGRRFLHGTHGCVGSFVETPVTSIDFDIPFTSKGKGRRKDSKGKDLQKQKERKSVVIKDIRSFSGGSTTVKSSSPLNSKEK